MTLRREERRTLDRAMMSSSEVLSNRALNRATLARQMLLERAAVTPAVAVQRLAGMQAQEPRPPFIGLWSRIEDGQREAMQRGMHERELVRGTLMRGTIHLVTAADYATFRPTIQPVLDQGLGLLGDRAEGLDEDADRVLAQAVTLLREEPRTFAELRSRLSETFPHINDRALGFLVRMKLSLVLEPIGHPWAYAANARFALADLWLEDALATASDPEALALRYLAAFGPATVADVQVWSGLRTLKPVMEALRPQLLTFRNAQGKELFDLPDAPRPDLETPAPVRFLPEFDNLLLSHADRTRVIADEHRGVVYQKGNLRLLSSFLVDGMVAGIWRVEAKRKAATLTLSPFASLSRRVQAELGEEGERLLRFLEPTATAHDIVFNAAE